MPIMLLLGLIFGVVALDRSPHRNRAIGGIVLSATGSAGYVALMIIRAVAASG